MPQFQGLGEMSLDRQWTATRYRMEESTRPIQTFNLEVIPWLRESDPVDFWPSPKYGRKPKPSGDPKKRAKRAGRKGRDPAATPPADDDERSNSSARSERSNRSDESGIDDPPGHGGIDELLIELLPVDEPDVGPVVPDPPKNEGGGEAPPTPEPTPPSPRDDPPPPPPKPPRVQRPKRRGGTGGGEPRYAHHNVQTLMGDDVGYILVNAHSKTLDAHCTVHAGDCAISRTYEEWTGEGKMTPLREARGRPAAFLVAWLRSARRYRGENALEAHFQASKGKDPAAKEELLDGESHRRKAAREFVDTSPLMADVRAAERPPPALARAGSRKVLSECVVACRGASVPSLL